MGDMARIDLRLDASVHRRLKQLADKSGLSLNQLLQGVARWASENGHPGTPKWGVPGEILTSANEPHAIWFGWTGMDGREYVGGARAAFVLDFTDKAAVRDSSEYIDEDF